jgi:hypothetical protein
LIQSIIVHPKSDERDTFFLITTTFVFAYCDGVLDNIDGDLMITRRLLFSVLHLRACLE